VLNDDLEVIAPDWIEALLEHSQRPEIGLVGALLLYPSDRIQHAGIVLGVNGPTTHIFCNQPADEPGYCGFHPRRPELFRGGPERCMPPG